MQIQIIGFLQRPNDLDLHCLQRQGFSRIKGKLQMPHQDISNDTHDMFSLTNKENIYLYTPLIWSYSMVNVLKFWAQLFKTNNGVS